MFHAKVSRSCCIRSSWKCWIWPKTWHTRSSDSVCNGLKLKERHGVWQSSCWWLLVFILCILSTAWLSWFWIWENLDVKQTFFILVDTSASLRSCSNRQIRWPQSAVSWSFGPWRLVQHFVVAVDACCLTYMKKSLAFAHEYVVLYGGL